MKRDTTLFVPDLKVDMGGEETTYDTSDIYTGEIYGTLNTFLSLFFIVLGANQVFLNFGNQEG